MRVVSAAHTHAIMAWRGGVANWRSCRSPHPVAFRERCSDKNASSCKMAWPDLGRPGSNLILVSYFESKSRHHGMMWMNLSVLWSVAGVCLKYLHLKQPKETRMRPGACGHLRAAWPKFHVKKRPVFLVKCHSQGRFHTVFECCST